MKKKSHRFYYGWVIVTVSFLTLFMALGIRFSFGVFYIAILKEYGWGRAATAGAFSLAMLSHAVFALISGTLIDRFGPRILFPLGSIFLAMGLVAASRITAMWHLYVFFGVAIAIGINTISFSPHMTLISKWFFRKRGLAIGLVLAGVGAGTMTLLPVTELMIEFFGWRSAFLLLAGLILGLIFPITALFQRRSPEEVGQHIDGVTLGSDGAPPSHAEEFLEDTPFPPLPQKWTLSAAVLTKAYWFIGLVSFTNGFVVNTLLVHQAVHVVDLGYTKLLAASLVGLVGLLGSIGGILFGSLSDRIGRGKSYALANLAAFAGIFFFMLMRDSASPWMLYTFVILYGLGFASTAPISGATTADLFPGNSLGKILATQSMFYGAGGALGPYLGGYFHDYTGSYFIPFLLCLAGVILGIIGIWMAVPRHQRP
ncbi:MAG: MFS transporter, partial [Pseudomonadota bacterium]